MSGKAIWFILAIGALAALSIVITLKKSTASSTPTIELPKIDRLIPKSTTLFEKRRLVSYRSRRWDSEWDYEYRAVFASDLPIRELKEKLEAQLDKKQWKPVRRELSPGFGSKPTLWTESIKGRRIEADPQSVWTKSWYATVTLLPGQQSVDPEGRLPIEGKSTEVLDNGEMNRTTVGVLIRYKMSKFTPPPPWKMAINGMIRQIGLPPIP